MVATITSSSNEKIKYVRSLERRSARERERRFVVEGTRLVGEALRAGAAPAFAFYTPDFVERAGAQALLERLDAAGVPTDAVAPHLLASIADTTTAPGILAVVPLVELRVPAEPTLVLIVDGVATPGNLGTLLRSAEAAGVELTLLTAHTTDPFAPKVVRGGMGVHFRLPMRLDQDWPAIAAQAQGMSLYLAEADAALPYDEVAWTLPSALIVGGEAHGPSPEARAHATAAIYIPMLGLTESLNAGVAGSVILFEAARQRRRQRKS